jgi:hypothetical protein
MKRIISISICMVFLLSASTILLAQEKVEEPMTFEEFKTKVKSIITSRNKELKKHFSEGKYDLMPGQLKEYNAKVVTHKGKVIPGRYSEDYWREVGKGLKGTNLNFKAPHLDFTDLGVDPDSPGYVINYVAVEITKFTFDVKGKKHKGYIDPQYRHRVRCTIED